MRFVTSRETKCRVSVATPKSVYYTAVLYLYQQNTYIKKYKMSSKIFVIHALAVNRQDAPRILYEFLVSTNSVNILGL